MITITKVWNHTEPTELDQLSELQLLTICGISVLGKWCGALGEHYVGWALVPSQPLLYYPHPYAHTSEQREQLQ